MYKLTAVYEVNLSGDLRVKRAESDKMHYETKVGAFSVNVTLIWNDGGKIQIRGEKHSIRFINKMKIEVSRYEDSNPPPVPRNKAGGRNLIRQSQYLWLSDRREDYRKVAVTAANRIIQFFKYKMHTSMLKEFKDLDTAFENPKWFGEDGEELASGSFAIIGIVPPGPGLRLLGEINFTEMEDEDLQIVLKNGLKIETFQEFLSDAQESIRTRKFGRAVLELAITCETAVKQAFFAKATPSGAAFEYFEDQGKIHIKLVELLDGVARQAFGESFKDVERTAYDHIDFLFRCRNKVAHRGEEIYRDDRGETHKVDNQTLEKWMASVHTLMKWIFRHRT